MLEAERTKPGTRRLALRRLIVIAPIVIVALLAIFLIGYLGTAAGARFEAASVPDPRYGD